MIRSSFKLTVPVLHCFSYLKLGIKKSSYPRRDEDSRGTTLVNNRYDQLFALHSQREQAVLSYCISDRYSRMIFRRNTETGSHHSRIALSVHFSVLVLSSYFSMKL